MCKPWTTLIILCIFLCSLTQITFGQRYDYFSFNFGTNIAMGKVSEMLKADLHPSKIDANRLYNNAYLFGIGFGFELDEKYGFILTLDVFKVKDRKSVV